MTSLALVQGQAQVHGGQPRKNQGLALRSQSQIFRIEIGIGIDFSKFWDRD